MDKNIYTPQLFSDAELDSLKPVVSGPVQCLGMEFENEEARREYFRDELRRKLPELRQIEGFPIGEDEDIIRLSDPPYYTACPNPWLNDIIDKWEEDKVELTKEGKRASKFAVNEPYSYGIKQGKNSAIYNAHTYHTKVPHEVIMRYILHYTQPGDIVLDSFAGTGMTGVAATLCKDPIRDIENDFDENGYMKPVWGLRHAICGDLSPLCYHISSNYNNTVDSALLNEIVDEILNLLKIRFEHFYSIIDPNTKAKGHINYFVWSEVVACNNCGEELNVHDLLFDYDTKTLHTHLRCPNCGTLQTRTEANSIKEIILDEQTKETISQLKYNCSLINYSIPKHGRYFTKYIPITSYPEFIGFIPTTNVVLNDL